MNPRCRSLPALTCLWLTITLSARAQSVKPSPAPDDLLLGLHRTEFQTRREALMKRVREARTAPALPPASHHGGGGAEREPIVVLRGADPPEADVRFRQTDDFAYLTGVEVPGAVLVMYPKQNRSVLYLPPRDPLSGFFTEPQFGPGPEAAERFGFAAVEPTTSLLADLFGAIGDAMLPGRGGSRAALFLRDPARPEARDPDARLVHLLREGAPNTAIHDVEPLIASLRKIKSPGELDHLRLAIAITADALDEAQRVLQPGVHEYTLQGAILGAFTRGGADGTDFTPIVGSGTNGTIPHYFGFLRKIADDDLVVVDIGASYDYYSADITRTYPASGHFSPRQREIYQLVLDAQKAAEAAIQPGRTRLADLTQSTRQFFRNSPLRARDEQGQEQAMDRFFIHGLGHDLGMDVHDVGDYGEPIQVGEVFTIEPGLYIKSESIGVRIEDDYLMTEHGLEKLSGAIPSQPDEVEKQLAARRGK